MPVSVLYRLLCCVLRALAHISGIDEEDLEIAVLRHQLRILRRGGKRPSYTVTDRAFLAAASRLLSKDRWSSFVVGPETLDRWHRALLRGRPQRRARRPGRPALKGWIRELIRRLARENPRWGYLRIRGELLNLGIDVSGTTIATELRRSGLGPAPRRIGPTWTQFLRLQALGILRSACRSDDGDDWFGDLTSEPTSPDGEPEVSEPIGKDGAMTADLDAVPLVLHQAHRGGRPGRALAHRSCAVVAARSPPFPPPGIRFGRPLAA